MTDNNKTKEEEKVITKEEHVINYIKQLDTIEQAIEPYREHKLALKKDYADKHFLSRADQSMILQAYRLLKKDQDMSDMTSFYELLKRKIKL